MKHPKKDANAVALGRNGGTKTSAIKTKAARENASQPPRPGKQVRGRPYSDATLAKALSEPFLADPQLAATFGQSATFQIGDVLKDGKITVPFSTERFALALAALQRQAHAAEGMLEQLVAGKKQDRTALNAAHVAMRAFKPEVDAIMAFVQSGNTSKTIPALGSADIADIQRFRRYSFGRRSY